MTDLGNLLINKRKQLKLSLRDASDLIGISHSYLSMLEKGVDPRTNSIIKPTPETLKLISDAYNLNYNDLMNLIGYITDTDIIESSNNSEWKPQLTKKDEKDIEKLLEATMDSLENTEGLMLQGQIVDKDDLEFVRMAIRNGLEYAKKVNKKKYTPKKFRK